MDNATELLLKGNWLEIKGKLRKAYGQLTDNELEQVKGNKEQLLGLIVKKTGKNKAEIEKNLSNILG